MYRVSVAFTLVYATYDVLTSLEFNRDGFAKLIGFVPFFDLGLGWVVLAIVGALIGYIADKLLGYEQISPVVQKINK